MWPRSHAIMPSFSRSRSWRLIVSRDRAASEARSLWDNRIVTRCPTDPATCGTARDFAEYMRDLVDLHHPQANGDPMNAPADVRFQVPT